MLSTSTDVAGEVPSEISTSKLKNRFRFFSSPYHLAEQCGLSFATMAYVLLLVVVDPTEFAGFVSCWMRAGMLLPLFALAAIGGAAGVDPLCVALNAPYAVAPNLADVPRLWLPLLLCAHPVWVAIEVLSTSAAEAATLVAAAGVTESTFAIVTESATSTAAIATATATAVGSSQLLVFFLLLICSAAAVELYVRRPLAPLMLPLLDLMGTRRLHDTESAVWEKLFGYFLSMGTVRAASHVGCGCESGGESVGRRW